MAQPPEHLPDLPGDDPGQMLAYIDGHATPAYWDGHAFGDACPPSAEPPKLDKFSSVLARGGLIRYIAAGGTVPPLRMGESYMRGELAAGDFPTGTFFWINEEVLLAQQPGEPAIIMHAEPAVLEPIAVDEPELLSGLNWFYQAAGSWGTVGRTWRREPRLYRLRADAIALDENGKARPARGRAWSAPPTIPIGTVLHYKTPRFETLNRILRVHRCTVRGRPPA